MMQGEGGSDQCLFPKGEFLKELYEGSLWFECLSFTLCYLDFFLTPLRPVPLIVVGGWVVGRISAPIYLIFWYINKQNVLISNMVSIGLYGFYIKS